MITAVEHQHPSGNTNHAIRVGGTCFCLNNARRIDPSRTGGIQRRFITEINRRFNQLKRDIKKSIIDNDCFGIQPIVHTLAPIPERTYAFETADEKIKKFMAWLEEQENLYILSEGREGLQIIIRPGIITGNKPWTNIFIDSAYSQGIRRAREELRRAGYDIASFEAFPRGIGGLMNQPFHAERVAAIYTRTFEDLKTVIQMMNGQTRRLIADGLTTGLAQGMAEGKNPMQIARELVADVANRVDKIGITRARLIARTEVVRAHHVANITEYRQADAEMNITVEVEWLTAGFDVCEECADLEGKTFTLDEIEGMIPVHPNCVTAETAIIAKDILSGMTAKYSGQIFKFEFSDGTRLSVTPNHMLATPDGFIMAKFLSQGDAVLCGSNIKGCTFSDPNDNRNPSRIDNIIRSLAKTVGVKSVTVPVSPEHLHGDGGMCEGDVHIVNSDGFLRDNLNTKFSEMFNQGKFNGIGIFDVLSLDSISFQEFNRLFMTPDSIMGGNREILAFLRGCICHAKKHGFTSISGSDSILLKTESDNVSCMAEIFRKLFDGKSTPVLFDDLLNIYRQAIIRSLSSAESNPSLKDSVLNGVPFCHAISDSQLRETFSGLISSLRITSIEIDYVSNTSVYDLSTLGTIYFANGILSSNCRCVARPIVKSEEK